MKVQSNAVLPWNSRLKVVYGNMRAGSKERRVGDKMA